MSLAPLQNANKMRLCDLPSMPDNSQAVMRLLSPLIFEKLQITNVNGLAQKVAIYIKTLASIQPLSSRALLVKPEGQRSWKWFQIHTATNVDLTNNDRIKIRGILYKVMAKFDYSRNGFFEFHVVTDFEGGDQT